MNLKLIFCILYILGIILWITGVGMKLLLFFFAQRSVVTPFALILLIVLAFIRVCQIIKQQGTGAIEFKFVKPFGFKFFGPIGDLITGVVSIYSAFYSGFTVLSLALLGQLPTDIPVGGLLFIEISMASLMGISGYFSYLLYRETFPKETVPPSQEATIQTDSNQQ